MKNYQRLQQVAAHFRIEGTVSDISPLGNGLINDTFKVTTKETEAPDYVLQRINHNVFKDVELLQHNIEIVTRHIRQKLMAAGENDVERKVLRFLTADNGKTFCRDDEGCYWRMSVLIPRSYTYNAVTPPFSYEAGLAFGHFESMLTDVEEQLGCGIRPAPILCPAIRKV